MNGKRVLLGRVVEDLLIAKENAFGKFGIRNLVNLISILINVLKWRAPCKSALVEWLPSLIKSKWNEMKLPFK